MKNKIVKQQITIDQWREIDERKQHYLVSPPNIGQMIEFIDGNVVISSWKDKWTIFTGIKVDEKTRNLAGYGFSYIESELADALWSAVKDKMA